MTSRKCCFVAFTVPTTTKYAEPCHSWSVLYRPLNCFPGVHHSMQIVPCLLVHTTQRTFHLRDFIDQNTVRRSLRPQTRPHETRTKSPDRAERFCCCSTPEKLAKTIREKWLSTSSQTFCIVGFVVLRQSVFSEHCFRQDPPPVTRVDSMTTLGFNFWAGAAD